MLTLRTVVLTIVLFGLSSGIVLPHAGGPAIHAVTSSVSAQAIYAAAGTTVDRTAVDNAWTRAQGLGVPVHDATPTSDGPRDTGLRSIEDCIECRAEELGENDWIIWFGKFCGDDPGSESFQFAGSHATESATRAGSSDDWDCMHCPTQTCEEWGWSYATSNWCELGPCPTGTEFLMELRQALDDMQTLNSAGAEALAEQFRGEIQLSVSEREGIAEFHGCFGTITIRIRDV